MDIDKSAVFLAGSVLIMLGFIIIVAGSVVINNILHKYWKPVRIFTSDSWSAMNPPARFATPEDMEKIAPHLNEAKVKK